MLIFLIWARLLSAPDVGDLSFPVPFALVCLALGSLVSWWLSLRRHSALAPMLWLLPVEWESALTHDASGWIAFTALVVEANRFFERLLSSELGWDSPVEESHANGRGYPCLAMLKKEANAKPFTWWIPPTLRFFVTPTMLRLHSANTREWCLLLVSGGPCHVRFHILRVLWWLLKSSSIRWYFHLLKTIFSHVGFEGTLSLLEICVFPFFFRGLNQMEGYESPDSFRRTQCANSSRPGQVLTNLILEQVGLGARGGGLGIGPARYVVFFLLLLFQCCLYMKKRSLGTPH